MHVTNAYGKYEASPHSFLTSTLGGGDVSFPHWLLVHGERDPVTHRLGSFVRPRTGETIRETGKCATNAGNQTDSPLLSSPESSHCTDYAVQIRNKLF
jgi:hypothetical protein